MGPPSAGTSRGSAEQEGTVCADPDCDSRQEPPPGESWCYRRLGIELWRWISGYPMRCGTPALVHLEVR